MNDHRSAQFDCEAPKYHLAGKLALISAIFYLPASISFRLIKMESVGLAAPEAATF
jgi:hypothetical protein